MTKRYCDHCKKEAKNPGLLTNIDLGGDSFVDSYMNQKCLMQGMLLHIELCPKCLQEFNWIAGAFYRNEISGTNPFKDSNE